MTNEVMTTIQEDKQRQIINVVKQTIFPEASDAELALFFNKCTQVGVNPLDKMIIPVKYAGKVSFIGTIDFLRSLAEDTKQYDGSDEPEYEGTLEVQSGDKIIIVPELCRVKVYRKEMTRPSIGIARWVEYYPGKEKGFKWLQMPYNQLAKCAEAAALRKGFPQKINKLYTEEEMMLTIAAAAGVNDQTNNNPKSGMQGPSELPQDDTQEEQSPCDEDQKSKRCISSKQQGLLYGKCKEFKVDPEAVKNYIGVQHKVARGHFWLVSWSKTGKDALSEFDRILKTISEQPDFFLKYAPVKTAVKAPQSQAANALAQTMGSKSIPAGTGNAPTPFEEFEINMQSVAESKGKSMAEAKMKACVLCKVDDISKIGPIEYPIVLKHLSEAL